MSVMVLAGFARPDATGARCDGGCEIDMADTTIMRWQYIEGDTDMTVHPGCEGSATSVRAWEGAHGDFCLIEVTKTEDGRWELTGGDSSWTEHADRTYGTPDDALDAVIGTDWREATEDDE